MQAVRSLIGTITWPFVVIVLTWRSSLLSLLMGIVSTFIGIGAAFLVPKEFQLVYSILVYLLGALLFWPLLTSNKNHAASMLVNLLLCGLLVGSAVVAVYRFL